MTPNCVPHAGHSDLPARAEDTASCRMTTTLRKLPMKGANRQATIQGGNGSTDPPAKTFMNRAYDIGTSPVKLREKMTAMSREKGAHDSRGLLQLCCGMQEIAFLCPCI